MTELVLGTAQLGFEGRYGVTNTAGLLGDPAVGALLQTAVDAGIRTFDTAEAYGGAESQLGALMPIADARYVTKFGLDDLPGRIDAARAKLRVPALYGLMLHAVADIDDERFPAVLDQLRAARDAGLVRRIGVSVYDVAELERCLVAFPDFDLLSFPGNVVDTRLLDHPLVAELHARGVECHIRSVFLQGLLLVPSAQLSPAFAALAPALDALGDDRLAHALAGIRREWVDGVTVGATSAAELQQIADAWASGAEPVPLPAVPEDLLDPRRWPR